MTAGTDARIAAALERLADTWQEQIEESKKYRDSLDAFEHRVRKDTGPSLMERQTIALEAIVHYLENGAP